MMEKEPFELIGKVEAVLVSHTFGSLVSTEVQKIRCIRGEGIKGDQHGGTRLLDVREKTLTSFGLPKGIEVANYREFSAVSVEGLAKIGHALKLTDTIPPGALGENLLLSGIPKLSELPTGTLLCFRDEAKRRTAVLAVWAENIPCIVAAEALQKCFPKVPDVAKFFVKEAMGKRGIVGSVYVSGNIHKGDTVVVKVPRQRIYTDD